MRTKHPGVLVKSRLEWCLTIYTSNQVQSDTGAVGLQTTVARLSGVWLQTDSRLSEGRHLCLESLGGVSRRHSQVSAGWREATTVQLGGWNLLKSFAGTLKLGLVRALHPERTLHPEVLLLLPPGLFTFRRTSFLAFRMWGCSKRRSHLDG